MDPTSLAAFVTVVRTGSFTGAAKLLHTQKAHVSRVVSRLEAELGVQLLRRSTRSLALTEVGRELYERAGCILDALDQTRNAIAESQGEPRGLLKLTCGQELGLAVVGRWVARYLEQYPKIRVELDVTNRIVDIIHEGFDLAIRVGPLPPSELSLRKLGDIQYGLYASSDYLRRRKAPRAPTDLAEHPLVMHAPSGKTPVWPLAFEQRSFEIRGPGPARLVTNDNLLARDMVESGLGIALLPKFLAKPLVVSGSLSQILPGWQRPPVPVHAVYASSRFLAPKVRSFVELARASFEISLSQ
jgi:DNA-binding transcriptional LysR family regulator